MSSEDGLLKCEMDEPIQEVLGKLEAAKEDMTITSIYFGHQQYMLEDDRKPILTALCEIIALQDRKWKRIEFAFSYPINSDKEHRRYCKRDIKFKRGIEELGQRIQRQLNLDQDDVRMEGNSKSIETPSESSIHGSGIIVFSKVRGVFRILKKKRMLGYFCHVGTANSARLGAPPSRNCRTSSCPTCTINH